MVKNGNLSGFYFYINLNIREDFQICISVPLRSYKYNCWLKNLLSGAVFVDLICRKIKLRNATARFLLNKMNYKYQEEGKIIC